MREEVPGVFVFMKVGDHAGEAWDSILARKQEEIRSAGVAFWGYSGLCHPIRQVQPFAKLCIERYGCVYMLMQKIASRSSQLVALASEFSTDGIAWEPIPPDVRTTGSRYAMVLDEIQPGELTVPLDAYEVGIGPSAGRRASEYVSGRVDKACLVKRAGMSEHKTQAPVVMSVRARLREPYAVLVR